MTFTTTDGKNTVTRVSRWIQIQHAYNITKRNSLYYYACDGAGYHPSDREFDPKSETYLDYFRYKGRTYAVEQFMLLSPFWGFHPYEFIDTDGNSTFITAYDVDGDLYNPLYAEFDEFCERVRLYTVELRKGGQK